MTDAEREPIQKPPLFRRGSKAKSRSLSNPRLAHSSTPAKSVKSQKGDVVTRGNAALASDAGSEPYPGLTAQESDDLDG